jgi:hypothetical protein
MITSNHHIFFIQHINCLFLCHYLALKHGFEGVDITVGFISNQVNPAEGAAAQNCLDVQVAEFNFGGNKRAFSVL